MPNTKSAKKALRGSERKRKFNKVRQYKIKNALKDLRKMVAEGSKDVANGLSKVYSEMDKAVKTNLLPKARVDRRKSRLSAWVKSASEGLVEAEKSVKKTVKKAASKAKTTLKKTAKK